MEAKRKANTSVVSGYCYCFKTASNSKRPATAASVGHMDIDTDSFLCAGVQQDNRGVVVTPNDNQVLTIGGPLEIANHVRGEVCQGSGSRPIQRLHPDVAHRILKNCVRIPLPVGHESQQSGKRTIFTSKTWVGIDRFWRGDPSVATNMIWKSYLPPLNSGAFRNARSLPSTDCAISEKNPEAILVGAPPSTETFMIAWALPSR
jgi:hypothetical protein